MTDEGYHYITHCTELCCSSAELKALLLQTRAKHEVSLPQDDPMDQEELNSGNMKVTSNVDSGPELALPTPEDPRQNLAESAWPADPQMKTTNGLHLSCVC